MSLIPFIIDLADELHELGRCLANGIDIDDFGFGIYAGGEHVQPPQHHQPNPRRTRSTPFYWLPSKRHHPYCRSKATCCSKVNTEDLTSGPVDREAPGTANTINSNTPSTPGKSAAYSVVNRNGFQVSMNVKQFAPNELSVKTINNCIIVEGRHDDKEDGHGVISRHFVRKYMLPKGYDPNDVTSTLSSDGILTVRAPPPLAIKNAERQERIVEIQPFSGPAQLTSAKENPKEPAKNILTANSTINPPAEKKQKLDQSQQSLQQTGDKVEGNKLAEALRENAAKALQLQNPQQQQQQNEPVDVIEKIIQSQQQEEENSEQTNEGSTQTNVVVVSLNIEKLQENGDTKSGETLISKPEAEAETMLESSNAAFTIPAKTTETTEAKNIGATTTKRTVHNDTLALTNSKEEHNSANSTVTLPEHQDANANITAVVANINSFVSTSATQPPSLAQPPPLLLRSIDNGIPDALPSIALQSTITGIALDDDDIEMDGAVASSHGNVEDEVALLKAVASNAVVVATKTTDDPTTIIEDKECDLFVKTHLDNSNKATLALVNEEITK